MAVITAPSLVIGVPNHGAIRHYEVSLDDVVPVFTSVDRHIHNLVPQVNGVFFRIIFVLVYEVIRGLGGDVEAHVFHKEVARLVFAAGVTVATSKESAEPAAEQTTRLGALRAAGLGGLSSLRAAGLGGLSRRDVGSVACATTACSYGEVEVALFDLIAIEVALVDEACLYLHYFSVGEVAGGESKLVAIYLEVFGKIQLVEEVQSIVADRGGLRTGHAGEGQVDLAESEITNQSADFLIAGKRKGNDVLACQLHVGSIGSSGVGVLEPLDHSGLRNAIATQGGVNGVLGMATAAAGQAEQHDNSKQKANGFFHGYSPFVFSAPKRVLVIGGAPPGSLYDSVLPLHVNYIIS